MVEKILKSKNRTDQGLVGYINNLFKEIDKVIQHMVLGNYIYYHHIKIL